jgi:hypothetical protein
MADSPAARLRAWLRDPDRQPLGPADKRAGLDEGLLQFSPSNLLCSTMLYGESLYLQEMPGTNNSAPSYIHAGR